MALAAAAAAVPSSAAASALSGPAVPAYSTTAAYHLQEHAAAGSVRAMPATYTVRPGDTLSAIAGRFYHSSALWPALWWVNKAKVRDPDVIEVGQHLTLSSWHPDPAWLTAAADRAIPALPQPAAQVRQVAYQTAVQPDPAPQAQYYSGGGYPGGSFGQCVVARESGGNAQVMNSTGHYGLYQFSESTWIAYGGSAADFGNASVGEQEQVFENALAQGGQSNWSAYDGC